MPPKWSRAALRTVLYAAAAVIVLSAIASSVGRLLGSRRAPDAGVQGVNNPEDARARAFRAQAAASATFLRAGPDFAFAAVRADSLRLRPSSFRCDGAEDPLHEVCIFQDVLVHQGDLIYIVQDAAAARALRLPRPSLYEVGNSPFQVTLAEHVVVATRAAALARLTASAAKGKRGGGRVLRVARFERAIFQRIRAFTNWFWALNGVGNVHLRLCKYMGACARREVQGTAVLQMARHVEDNPKLKTGPPGDTYDSVRELMQCFGPFVQVNHAAGDRSRMAKDDRVLLLDRMLVGVGDEVLEPLSAKSANEEPQFKQANATMGLRRVQYIRQCAGLPPTPPRMRTPSVLLVNRPFDGGRHIIGLDDVYDRLRRRLPPQVPVRLYLPRIESLAAQAEVFALANVVVVPHGAGNANFIFLPRTAVVFGVHALVGRYAVDDAHMRAMPSPPYNLTLVPVECSERVEVRVSDVAALPAFQALPPAQRAKLLANPPMQRATTELLGRLLGFTPLDWMDFAAYMPDPEELAALVAGAVGGLMPTQRR